MPRENLKTKPYTVVDPTWGMALKVYWSLLWRLVCWVLPVSFGLMIIGGLIVKFTGGSDQDVGIIGSIILIVLMLAMTLIVIKRLLKMRYKEFRIITVSRKTPMGLQG